MSKKFDKITMRFYVYNIFDPTIKIICPEYSHEISGASVIEYVNNLVTYILTVNSRDKILLYPILSDFDMEIRVSMAKAALMQLEKYITGDASNKIVDAMFSYKQQSFGMYIDPNSIEEVTFSYLDTDNSIYTKHFDIPDKFKGSKAVMIFRILCSIAECSHFYSTSDISN